LIKNATIRRYLTKYHERHPDEDAIVVSTIWEFSEKELEIITAELGEGVVEQEVKIRRRYQATEPEWEFDINVQKAIENVLSTNVFEVAQIATLQAAQDEAALIERIASFPSPTPEQQELLSRLRGYGTFKKRALAIAKSFFPSFMYFSNYDRMDGAVQLEQLKQIKADGQINQDEYSGTRLFMEFLEFSGVQLASHGSAPLSCKADHR
jgi:hypothetical protein